MVQFASFPSPLLVIPGYCPGGFPHSESLGSTVAYTSPRSIVVRHVLHRLLVPRHPPHTLSILTKDFPTDAFFLL